MHNKIINNQSTDKLSKRPHFMRIEEEQKASKPQNIDVSEKKVMDCRRKDK